MPNTYACKGVSNPNVPIFLPRVCTLVLFIINGHSHTNSGSNYGLYKFILYNVPTNTIIILI